MLSAHTGTSNTYQALTQSKSTPENRLFTASVTLVFLTLLLKFQGKFSMVTGNELLN